MKADRPLKPGRYLLTTDGGVRNDGHRTAGDAPGEAAIGVVLNDPDDHVTLTHSEKIGPESIQGAEYRALVKGLELALELGIDKIRAFVDNQLIVDQIHGLADVRDQELKALHGETIAPFEAISRSPNLLGASRT